MLTQNLPQTCLRLQPGQEGFPCREDTWHLPDLARHMLEHTPQWTLDRHVTPCTHVEPVIGGRSTSSKSATGQLVSYCTDKDIIDAPSGADHQEQRKTPPANGATVKS